MNKKFRSLRTIQRSQFYTKSHILKRVTKILTTMTFITPESNVYFENYHLTTPKNRAESSDVTFEEVLPIYVKGDFKECLT